MATFEPGHVDAFLAGAIGRPGARTFFLQVAGDGALVSMKCEKQHVATLVEALGALLRDLPPVDRASVPTLGGLRTPVVAEWSIGPMGLGYEASTDRIVILIGQMPGGSERNDRDDDPDDDRDDDDDELTPANATVRCSITRAQAAAFIEQGTALVSAGRPLCLLCSSPIDPEGFTCACWN
jgi:uncharacterized repeat protein (TIGR03847 family)